jgi:hypothetical protein
MFGKNTLTRVVVIAAIVAAAALAIATVIGFAAGGFVPRQFGRAGAAVDERKSIELEGIDLISVTFVSGKTRVVEAAGSSLEVRVHGMIAIGNPDAAPHLVVQRAGSTVTVSFERPQPLRMGISWNNLELEVGVPRGFAKGLAVKTVSAGLQVADHAYTSLDLSTTSGDVTVGAVSAQSVSLRTTSGDLRATRLAAQRVEISSVSGDVAISLPGNAQFELDARSTSGRVTCVFPITIKENRSGGGSNVLSGTVGAGGSVVTVSTVSGDISIAR